MSPKSHFLLSQTSGKGFLTCCSSFLIPIHSLTYGSWTIFLPPSNSQRWSTASLTRKCKDLCTAFTSQQCETLLGSRTISLLSIRHFHLQLRVSTAWLLTLTFSLHPALAACDVITHPLTRPWVTSDDYLSLFSHIQEVTKSSDSGSEMSLLIVFLIQENNICCSFLEYK